MLGGVDCRTLGSAVLEWSHEFTKGKPAAHHPVQLPGARRLRIWTWITEHWQFTTPPRPVSLLSVHLQAACTVHKPQPTWISGAWHPRVPNTTSRIPKFSPLTNWNIYSNIKVDTASQKLFVSFSLLENRMDTPKENTNACEPGLSASRSTSPDRRGSRDLPLQADRIGAKPTRKAAPQEMPFYWHNAPLGQGNRSSFVFFWRNECPALSHPLPSNSCGSEECLNPGLASDFRGSSLVK
jgi:hypothetical protein